MKTFPPLCFVPLGGIGEIGKNCYLYGCDGKWLMVDLGLTFADGSQPGVEVLVPDISFIIKRREDLLGLVITHAHEDHLGAVPYLWQHLDCPIFASPFAAALIKHKSKETGIHPPITFLKPGQEQRVGSFKLMPMSVTHSTPESMAIGITTKHGTILHSGDWKLDENPVIGKPYDLTAIKDFSAQETPVYIGDSTNILETLPGGSEGDILKPLTKIMQKSAGKRVVVTCFSSNVARLQTIAKAAQKADRDVGILGRSIGVMDQAARSVGYLKDVTAFLTDAEIGHVPREKSVLITTGCQGEPRSALMRLAYDSHPQLSLDAGDVVVFSSSNIPGNEKNIFRVQNQLIKRGIEVITNRDAPVHVTGHPGEDEVKEMYKAVKPNYVIPMHGEAMHLQAHANFALKNGVKQALVIENGDVVEITKKGIKVTDQVKAGALAIDGTQLLAENATSFKEKSKVVWNGLAIVSLAMDDANRPLPQVEVSLIGVTESKVVDDLLPEISELVFEAVEQMPKRDRAKRERVVETIKSVVRKALNYEFGKKPMVEVHILEL